MFISWKNTNPIQVRRISFLNQHVEPNIETSCDSLKKEKKKKKKQVVGSSTIMNYTPNVPSGTS